MAAIDCFGRYLGFFLIAIGISIAVGLLLAPQLGAILWIVAQLIAITMASVQATKADDAKWADRDMRASTMALGLRYWVVLSAPWIALAFALVPLLPDTMAGGYVLVSVAMGAAVAGPICGLIGASAGSFMAR